MGTNSRAKVAQPRPSIDSLTPPSPPLPELLGQTSGFHTQQTQQS